MTLLLVKESLKIRAGGAEKVFTTLLNAWVAEGKKIHLMTFDPPEGNSFYPLTPGIPWTTLHPKTYPQRLRLFPGDFLKRFFSVRAFLKELQPRGVIVFGDFMNVFISLVCKTLGIPVIISDRNNPCQKKLSPRWERLKKWTYPWAQRLVVMTEAQKTVYPPLLQTKISIIPNPVHPPRLSGQKNGFPPSPYILAIGKLMHQKGLDVLVRSAAPFLKQNPG